VRLGVTYEVLREVGAVDVRDEGRQRLYRLNGHALKPIGMTSTSETATVTLPTDEEILITREFDAPKHLSLR
jgi:DNA-binding transcriptional ArsR family regulator